MPTSSTQPRSTADIAWDLVVRAVSGLAAAGLIVVMVLFRSALTGTGGRGFGALAAMIVGALVFAAMAFVGYSGNRGPAAGPVDEPSTEPDPAQDVPAQDVPAQ